MNMKVGDTLELSEQVTEELTAKTWGSGTLDVYATPAMINLVERTAVKLLDGKLNDGDTSVGTKLHISHVAATPIGGTINCKCLLTEIDRKRLEFHVEVTDEAGRVGIGTHERFIVNAEAFTEKTSHKFNK